jgi:hypothetical protein
MTNPTGDPCNPCPERPTSPSRKLPVGMSSRPPGARLANRAPLLGVAAGILFFTGIGSLGDTPDTRDSAAQIAAWFSLHRTNVLIFVPTLTLSTMTFVAFVGVLAEFGQRRARSVMLCAGTLVAATILGSALMYAGLAYFATDQNPTISQAFFELTLVSAPILATPIALLLACTATYNLLPKWFRIVSIVASAFLVVSAFSFAARGPLSPDVAQQIVWQTFVLWLLVAGVVVSRVRSAEPGTVRSASAASTGAA